MPDRTGALSNFPSSLDQFAIKKPFDSSKPLSQQEIDSLEQSAHINHMFDAIYNIETHFLSGNGGAGGAIVTRWSNGVTGSEYDVYGPNLRLSYTTLNLSITGNTTTVTALAPSGFGLNPFDLKGFAVSHNLYITNPEGAANTQGIWANKSWGDSGPFNETLKWFQFFTLIRPVTGRVYEVTVKNLPYHSTSQSISPTFEDSFKITPGLNVENLHERTGWTGEGNLGLHLWTGDVLPPGITYWYAKSEQGNDPRYGWAWSSKLGSMTDSYVEWGEISNKYATPDNGNECFTRVGPMTRATGTINNASFYCVAIGDVPWTAGGLNPDIGAYGRIIKVVGANLSHEGDNSPDGGGTTWGGNPTITYIGTGAAYVTSSSGYYWFGDFGVRYRLKCETVTGSAKITIQQATSPFSSWSTLYGPFYDGVSPLSAGYSGFFSQAMNGEDNRYIRFLNGIEIGNLLSDTAISTEVQLMFMLAGPEANLTTESGE